MAEVDTTCSLLLDQLQEIWDEVGESDEQRDKILLELEQECLDVYKRKVDQVAKSRAHRLQTPAEQKPLLDYTSYFLVRHQLQKIWEEDGESKEQRDKMLLQLEQECLDVYKRKVDQAAKSRAHLLQTLADAELELSTLLASLGEKTFVGTPSGTIREKLAAIAPALEQLWKQKEVRIKEVKIEEEVCLEKKIEEQVCLQKKIEVNLEENTLIAHLQRMFSNTDEQCDDDELENIIEIASKKEAASLIMQYQKAATDDPTLCMSCNKHGDLIEFTYQAFPFRVHKSCLSPHGSYTLALSDYMKAKKGASMAKEKLLAFLTLGDKSADDESLKADQKPQCPSASRVVVDLFDDDDESLKADQKPQCPSASRVVVDLSDDDDESLKADQKPQCTSASRVVVDLSDNDDGDDCPQPKPPCPPTITSTTQMRIEDYAGVVWKASEEQKLQEGVDKFTVNGRISWVLILKYGEGVFHSSRNTASLRAKYCYMQKRSL